MRNKIILIIISISVMVTLSGCITIPNTISGSGEEKVIGNERTGPDWCKPGTKITTSGQNQQRSYKIKGIATYNDTEVCEAVIISDNGSIIQYFNEKKDYMVMIYKDKDGKIINHVNIANPK